MKVIIAGSREFNDYDLLVKICDIILKNKNEEIIIMSGGAKGADTLGEKYAKERNYKIIKILPEWNKYGKQAGILRNIKMAHEADYLIAFWDGKSKGTKHMIEYADSIRLEYSVKEYK